MNKGKIVATTILSAALMPWATGEAQAAIVQAVDPLTTTQSIGRTTPGTSTNSLAITGTPFGSSITRRVTLQQTAGRGQSLFEIPDPNLGPGISFSNNTNVNTIATIDYLGTGVGGAFSPTDLTFGGQADRVSLGIILNDLPLGASTIFRVSLNDVTVTKSFNVDYDNPGSPFPLDFLFTDFAGVNPTSVTKFSVGIDPPANGDVSLKFLAFANDRPEGAPEPATMLGLLAIAGASSTLLRKTR